MGHPTLNGMLIFFHDSHSDRLGWSGRVKHSAFGLVAFLHCLDKYIRLDWSSCQQRCQWLRGFLFLLLFLLTCGWLWGGFGVGGWDNNSNPLACYAAWSSLETCIWCYVAWSSLALETCVWCYAAWFSCAFETCIWCYAAWSSLALVTCIWCYLIFLCIWNMHLMLRCLIFSCTWNMHLMLCYAAWFSLALECLDADWKSLTIRHVLAPWCGRGSARAILSKIGKALLQKKALRWEKK